MKSTAHSQASAELEHTKSANDGAVQRFKATKRLSAEDQRTAAINLGKLAASLNPDNPSKAVKQIVAEAKMMEVLDKRKRFFRLPNEDAPIAAKDGTYNANPVKYLNLARAAARLWCGSSDAGLQEKEAARAQRILLLGTSFLPIYTPATQAEKSVQALLDEYAVRLAEAIEKRTKIKDLWEVLETTPISLEVSDEPIPPSIYGPSADLPPELLKQKFQEHIQHGQFEPSRGDFDFDWAEPSVQLGYLMVTHDLYALVIPEERADLFPEQFMDVSDKSGESEKDRNEWLESIGFDVNGLRFRDGEVGRNQVALTAVTVGFIFGVSIFARKSYRGCVQIALRLWRAAKGHPSDPFYGDFLIALSDNSTNRRLSKVRLMEKFKDYVSEAGKALPVRPITLGPPFDAEKFDDDDYYDNYMSEYYENCLLAYGCCFPHEKPPKVLLLKDSFNAECWLEEDDYEEFREVDGLQGWIDDQKCAKLLLGQGNVNFVPTILEAEPIAGAARAGSIAASILQNAITAAPESRISQIMIDQANLTAESGLKFHEAMIEATRSAIIKI